MPLFNIFGKTFKVTFLLIVIYEVLSFWGQAFSLVNLLGFLLIVGATLVIGLWRLKYAFWMITAELIIGSFGYMFFLDIGSFRFSVRLGMFLAIIFAFLVNSLRKKEFAIYKKSLWWPLVVFVAVLGLGVATGLANGNIVKNVFFDVNAYFFIALIMVSFAVFNSSNRINQWLQVVFSSVAAMAVKTFFLIFYFSHQTNLELFRMMYIWVRDTRACRNSSARPMESRFASSPMCTKEKRIFVGRAFLTTVPELPIWITAPLALKGVGKK